LRRSTCSCATTPIRWPVEHAWNTRLKPEAFKKVYDRLYVVLALIIADNGGNNLVESKRGKLFRDPVLPDEMEQQVDDEEPEAPDLLFDDEESGAPDLLIANI
jgi:hypothetical protein